MRSGTIAFLAGILALQQFTALPELHWWLWICLLLPVGLYFRHPGLKIINWLIVGFIWAWLNAHWILNQSLPENLEGKNVTVTGYIAGIPIQKGCLWQFEFDIHTASLNKRPVTLPKHVRLNWYGQAPRLSVGDRWRLTVRLKRPHGFMNPGGFDYEQWLFTRRIRATGYVRTKAGYTLLSSHGVDYPVQRLRQTLQTRIMTYLPDHPLQGVVSALVIGYRENISPPQWRVFRQTGTNHLVAISGLHIGLLAGLVFLFSRWCWARLGRLPLILAAPRAAALAALLAAGVYAALAGWSLPTQRALIMLGVVMLAIVLRRHVTPSYGLALALFLVLLHDHLAVLSPGFWLSFGAVGLIFLGMQGKRNGIQWWNKGFRVQWIIGLGLLPLLLLFFQQSSLVSPVANFIAIPVVSLLVVPLLLIGILLGAAFEPAGRALIEFGATILEYLTTVLTELGKWPHADWIGTVPDSLVLLLSMAGILMLLFAPLRTARWLGTILLLPLFFHQAVKPAHGQAFFTLLDVGQGLSAVIQTRYHTLVFDTGPRFSNDFDTGSAVLVPFLHNKQISRVDTLIVSHGDNDHIGGVEGLASAIPIKQIYSSAPGLIQDKRGSPCVRGQHWQWDGVIFRMLNPGLVEGAVRNENNGSCVLFVMTRHGSVLLPGDIEKAAEYRLLEQYRDRLKADILVAPHHGSKTSSSREFIAAVKPEFVLFSVGYRNRYHFPYAQVVKRYLQAGAASYDTARYGAISFKLGTAGSQLRPVFDRRRQQRYWHRKTGY